ncbi:hypothetical protein DBR47_22760 [Paucibacter sp. KBW04]|nr:hypothetical protein DBR47_22760 [Paucibacter sp. KBW04]
MTLPDTAEHPSELWIQTGLPLNSLDKRGTVKPEEVFYRPGSKYTQKRLGPRLCDRSKNALPGVLGMLSDNVVEFIEPDQVGILLPVIFRVRLPSGPQKPLFYYAVYG